MKFKTKKEKQPDTFRRIIFNYGGKDYDYFRPSQVRDVPIKYRCVRGHLPSLKHNRFPFLEHLNDLTLVYESQLERDFLSILDHDPNCLDLQSQPCSIDYITRSGKKTTLYPDIWALFSDGKQILFEVKPEEKLKELIKNENWEKRFEAKF